MTPSRRLAALACAGTAMLLTGLPARAAGPRLRCGVVVEQEDFTKSDTHGDLSRLGVTLCRAVTAAWSDDVPNVAGFPDDAHGLGALQAHRIDLLVGSTPDAVTAARLHVAYARPVFTDGQGFLLRRSLQASRLEDLRNTVICYISGTPGDQTLIDAMRSRHIGYRPHPFEETGEMEAALIGGSCDVVTADISALAAMRSGFHGRRADFVILPDTISQDPYAPVLRAQDQPLEQSVRLVEEMLDAAAQAGIGQQEVRDAHAAPALTRLGARFAVRAAAAGFRPDWVTHVLAIGGNRHEMLAQALDGQPANTLPATLLR